MSTCTCTTFLHVHHCWRVAGPIMLTSGTNHSMDQLGPTSIWQCCQSNWNKQAIARANGPIGAIIAGEYKLVVGKQEINPSCDSIMFSPLNYPCDNGAVSNDCEPYDTACIYNIIDDPGERKDLSQTNMDVLQRMIDCFSCKGRSKHVRSRWSQSIWFIY